MVARIPEEFEPDDLGGTRHTITYEVVPTGWIGDPIAHVLAAAVIRSRRRYQRRLRPVQRVLSEVTVDDVVRNYVAGSSIDSLARQLGVNRTTIISHLDRRGIERRKVVRKMTGRIVQRAATRYRKGESLKVVAAQFDVDARTLAREFGRAGVPIRPRRGWPPST